MLEKVAQNMPFQGKLLVSSLVQNPPKKGAQNAEQKTQKKEEEKERRKQKTKNKSKTKNKQKNNAPSGPRRPWRYWLRSRGPGRRTWPGARRGPSRRRARWRTPRTAGSFPDLSDARWMSMRKKGGSDFFLSWLWLKKTGTQMEPW